VADYSDAEKWAEHLSAEQLKLWASPEAKHIPSLSDLADFTGLTVEELRAEAYIDPAEGRVTQWLALMKALRDERGVAVLRRRAAEKRMADLNGDDYLSPAYRESNDSGGFPVEVPADAPTFDFANEDEAARFLLTTYANKQSPAYDSDAIDSFIGSGQASGPLLLSFAELLIVRDIGEVRGQYGIIDPDAPDDPVLSPRLVGGIGMAMQTAEMKGRAYPAAITELMEPLGSLADRLGLHDRRDFFLDALYLSELERRVWVRMNGERAHRTYSFPKKVRRPAP
jgi:hypothetical protein